MIITVLSSAAVCPWADASFRKINYPSDRFYVSYYELHNEDNDMNACISKTVAAAQSKLANEIYSEVSSVSVSRVEMLNQDSGYSETESFFNEFSSAASARLVNVHIDQDYDRQTATARAIAYVSKEDLAEFCEAKVVAGINSVKSKIDNIDRLVGSGYKSEAKAILDESIHVLQSISVFLSQLTAVRPDKVSQTDFVRQLEALSGKCMTLKSDLKQAIAIFVDARLSSAIVRNHPLAGKCKGILAKSGCNPVDSPEKADYIIRIDCETRTSSGNGDLWYAFADISMSVERIRDRKVIYDDAISVKGGGGTEERAHRKALDYSPDEICEHIINCLH